MTARLSLFALAVVLTFASGADAADWSKAGGALFVPPAPPEPLARRSDDPVAAPQAAQPFAAMIAAAASRHGLDPKLLHALVLVESGYRPDAVSRAGAVGLTQLMPQTARDLGVDDRRDPAANLAGGAAYLARMLLRFGDLRLALAAYNAGPERVARLGRTPNIPETQAYVSRVVECYLALAAGRSVRSPRQCQAADLGTGGPP